MKYSLPWLGEVIRAELPDPLNDRLSDLAQLPSFQPDALAPARVCFEYSLCLSVRGFGWRLAGLIASAFILLVFGLVVGIALLQKLVKASPRVICFGILILDLLIVRTACHNPLLLAAMFA
jgi:hypothetical protein